MPENHAPHLDPEPARQGETSGHMRRVLAISFAGAVVVLAALLIWWSKAGQQHVPQPPPSLVLAPSVAAPAVAGSPR